MITIDNKQFLADIRNVCNNKLHKSNKLTIRNNYDDIHQLLYINLYNFSKEVVNIITEYVAYIGTIKYRISYYDNTYGHFIDTHNHKLIINVKSNNTYIDYILFRFEFRIVYTYYLNIPLIQVHEYEIESYDNEFSDNILVHNIINRYKTNNDIIPFMTNRYNTNNDIIPFINYTMNKYYNIDQFIEYHTKCQYITDTNNYYYAPQTNYNIRRHITNITNFKHMATIIKIIFDNVKNVTNKLII